MNLDKSTEKKINDKAFFYAQQSRPNWNVPHLQTAIHYMKELLKNEGGEEKILLPAIYLHDIGYFGTLKETYSHEDNLKVKAYHMTAGAKMAEEILNETGGFGEEEIKKISYLISIHDNLKKIAGHDAQLIFEADSLAQIDVGRVKPNFDKENFNLFINEYIERRVPLFKTETGLKILTELLPKAKNYYN